jgi:hypothetical protein
MNPGVSFVKTAFLSSPSTNSSVFSWASVARETAPGHLHEVHERRRVAVVGAHDALRVLGPRSDARHRQGRGVRVEQRLRAADVIQFPERRGLQPFVFEDRLDHHVAAL